MSALGRLIARSMNRAGLGVQACRLLGSDPSILLYHGVTDEPRRGIVNCTGKHVTVERFERQLAAVARHRKMVPLVELVSRLRDRQPCRDMVAVTFDDGYLNNLECAAPVLQRMGIPATFFLATGFIGVPRWMWQDRLESALDSSRVTTIRCDVLPEATPIDSDERKRVFLRRVNAALKSMHWRDAEAQTEQVAAQLGSRPCVPHGLYRFMSWDHVRTLARRGFDIGAHSVNHAILSRIDPGDARREILDSAQHVRDQTGDCCRVFCYPNGKPGDYSPDVMSCCREHFSAALSTQWGAAKAGMMHELARIIVDDETRPETLAGWVAGAG